MVMFHTRTMVKILRYDEVATNFSGKPVRVVGEVGLVVRVNDNGTGLILLRSSNVVIDGVIPEDCEPAE